MLTKETDNFESLVEEIGRTGAYEAPQNLSYAMAITVNRMGGWIQVCSWRYKDFPFQRKVFKEVHAGVLKLLSRPLADTLGPVDIAGIHTKVQIFP